MLPKKRDYSGQFNLLSSRLDIIINMNISYTRSLLKQLSGSGQKITLQNFTAQQRRLDGMVIKRSLA